jgi:hypothetical protein
MPHCVSKRLILDKDYIVEISLMMHERPPADLGCLETIGKSPG